MSEREAVYRITVATEGQEDVKATQKSLEELEQELDDLSGRTIVTELAPLDLSGWDTSEAKEHLDELSESVRRTAADARAGVSGFEAARESIRAFGDAAHKGGDGLDGMAAKSRAAINRLRDEIDALRRSGKGLTDEHEKELEQLQREYDQAIAATARFRRAQAEANKDIRDAGRAAGDVTGPIGGLNDVLEQMGGRWGAIATKAFAVVGAFSAGYDAGTKFRDGLAQIDEALGTSFRAGLDDTVTKLFRLREAADAWVGAAPSSARQSEFVANALKILRSQGIEPASHAYEDLVKQLEEVKRAQGELNLVDSALKKWAEDLDIFGPTLDKNAKDFAKFAADFRAANAQIKDERLAEALKPQIQEILDQYKRLGQEAPAEFRKLADGFGIVDTATEKTLTKVEGFAKKYLAELARAANGGKTFFDTSAESLAGVQLALSEFKLPADFALLPPKVQDDLRRELASMIEAVQQSGGAYTKEIESLAAYAGLLIAPWGRVADGAKTAAQALDQVGTAAGKAGTSIQDSGKSLITFGDGVIEIESGAKTAAQALDQVGTAAGKAGTSIQDSGKSLITFGDGVIEIESGAKTAAQALDQVGTAAGEAGDKADEGAKDLASSATSAATAKTEIDRLAEALDQAGISFGKAAPAIDQVGTSASKAGSSFQTSGRALTTFGADVKVAVGEIASAAKASGPAGDELKKAGDKAGDGAKGLQDQATAAGAAQSGLAEVAAKSGAVADGQARAADAVTRLQASLAPMAESTGAVAAALAKIDWSRFSAEVEGRLTRINGELGKMLERIQLIDAAMANLTGAEGAAAGAKP